MVYTNYANTVSAHSANSPGYMGTVRIVVHWVGIPVEGIDTVNVIDISIAIIIDTIASNFTWVYPSVSCKVFMIVVNTRINYADYHIAITCGDIPRFRCVDIYISSTAGLTGVIQTP